MPETATAGRDLRAALDSNRAAEMAADIATNERLRVPPDMIYAKTATGVATRRKAFIRKCA